MDAIMLQRMIVKKANNDLMFHEYSELLDNIGQEAIKNGLTDDILEKLLIED